MIYIYGLVCPLSGFIRYIGKSNNPQKRLRAHVSAAVRFAYDHHTARWLRKLSAASLLPDVKILHVVASGDDWRESERSWIARAQSEGWPITNTTAGGEGLDFIDAAAASKFRENHRRAMTAWAATPQGVAAIARMKECSNLPEARKRRRDSQRKTWSDPQRRENLRSAIIKAQRNPETKAKRSKSSRAAWAADHDGMMSKIWTPEARERHRKARAGSWADPVIGAKLRAIHSSPEVRAKKSEGARRRATPEYRAMMAEKTRLSWEKRRKTKGA